MIQSFDLLDLTIALTLPPENAPADAIASMTLRCEALGLNHVAGLLTDPLTSQERAELRWYLEEYWQWPYAEFAERGKRIEVQLSEIGKRLYQAAFGGALDLVQSWQLQPAQLRQISIISTIPAALSLPWELLHDERGYLVLRTGHPVALLRRLEQRGLGALLTQFVPPLRVLVVTARPSGTGFLDPRSLARELLDAVQPQIDAGTIAVEFLRPPTRAALRQRLAQTKRPVYLLHFDGHGVFAGPLDPHGTLRKQGGGQGMLAFENEEGELDLVPAEDLAQLLQDSEVKLAVLDACQSAMSAADDAFSSVAARLIQGGVDATVAMSASVLVVTSTRFFARFYRELATGMPAPIAQERARQALYDDPRRHLFRRRADEEGQPIELRDWWLPHFYQQRPLTLHATRAPRKRKTQQTTAPVRFNDAMPPEPRYHFSGRARELLQIERHLLRKRLVVLSGFGGVGKTALAREAADWLTRTGLYSSACFVSFEHGGDASLLLSTLGTHLGVHGGHETLHDPVAALTRLQPALHARLTLVIADNLESLLPKGEAPLEREGREQLWHVLRELARLGAGVLLTTRAPLGSEDQLSPGAHVAVLPLRGLLSQDAYALATRLLEDLAIPRIRAPYADLRDLLADLDHHPLAIQLVVPTLQERSLDTIRADFAALLPTTFVDDTVTGRNGSLLASLDYSLRRLSDAQRVFLPRLAIFEGGANEDNLLAITQIPEADWAALRPALEQAALLTPEPIAGITFLFLRFHPVLTPYLRTLPGAATADPTLRARCAQRYATVASSLFYQDKHHPQGVRALVRKELPNLRQALAFFLEAGDLEVAAELANRIAFFLTLFGRWRERDELRRCMGTAVAAQQATEPGVFTYAEFMQESGLGEDEFRRGNLRAATARFTRLLARIEALPAGTPPGRNSFEHFLTLAHLARCQFGSQQLVSAEQLLRQSLVIADALLQQQPEDTNYQIQRGTVLGDLAAVLRDQGQYPQAHDAYEELLALQERLGDRQGQTTTGAQLGAMAFKQHDYAEAQARYLATLHTSQEQDEPLMEAVAWHNLGLVAETQHRWSEAERCYRKGLAIQEHLGDAAMAAATCNQLAEVAVRAGRPGEAEGWHMRALELDAQAHPGSPDPAHLHNLAVLLVGEVRAGRAATTRLTEAKRHAEQALALKETSEASGEIWKNFDLLAEIADLEGQAEVAQRYRRSERETYAAFAGNRYHIDRQYGQLIAVIVAGAQGKTVPPEANEAALPQLRALGRKTVTAIGLIRAGERDWHTLAEDLDYHSALLILRVLETLPASGAAPVQPTPEAILAMLPAPVLDAVQQGDQAALDQALAALAPEEQQRVMLAVFQSLQWQAEDGEPEQGK